MSDAFGSDTTASGGLQSDMPGIGAAPPKPSQVPSALGGLASAFKQMFGGAPPPQPARGPSFGPQGQLQPPQPQQGPRQPRMDSTTASLAIPKGSPQPPAKFTPYIKSQPTRDFSEWGQPEPFPSLPASFEVPSIYKGVGQFFSGQGPGQGGSQGSIPLAFLLTGHADEYVKGLMQGQEFKAKQAREAMQDAALKLQFQQEEEHHSYADVLAQYAALNETGEPTKMIKPINGVGLMDAMHNQAAQLGDDKMMALIENGANAKDIMEFQKLRDASLRDLQKANAKTDEQTAADELYGLKPATAQSGGGALDTTPDWAKQPGAEPASAGAPSPSDPSKPTPASPGQPDASGQVAGPGAPSQPGQPLTTGDIINDGAMQILKGSEPPGFQPPDVKNRMAIRAADMRKRAGEILRDPNLKPDQVVSEVEKQLGPQAAADLKGYSQYRAGPGATGQAGGGKEQGYWDMLGDLAQKALPGDPANAKPGWSKSTYQAVRDFREGAQKPNSPIQRIPTSVEAANNVLNDLDAIQKRDGTNASVSPESLSGAAGKDPLYAQLKIDWIRYNEDIDVLTRGTPSVGMAEQAINTQPQIPYFGSVFGYRAAVRRDMDQAQSRVQQLHGTWEQYQTGDPMPGFNPQAERDMGSISKLDFTTGAKPGQVITHPDGSKWRYLGANPENPGDIATNWRVVSD
ncbi:MAG TPA: hypothetical protein VHT52_19385 [Stellaceae bacterium]|jgi:hypothetical protein|nr:hypothetical protein [Stellaceae bacterium]